MSSNEKIFIFDIEAYEFDQKKIIEIGFLSSMKGQVLELEHIIIEENIALLNGRYVENNKYNFNFGKSKTMSLNSAIEILSEKIEEHDIIMGQGISNDFRYLRNNASKELNQKYNYQKMFEKKKVIDTAKMTFCISEDANTMSIGRVLDMLNIDNSNLHNAGNDALYTLEMAKGIVSYKNTLNILNQKQKEIEEQNKTKKKLKKSIVI